MYETLFKWENDLPVRQLPISRVISEVPLFESCSWATPTSMFFSAQALSIYSQAQSKNLLLANEENPWNH